MAIEFQELIDVYYQNLYLYALSISGSREDAWDLTQQTFLIWARKGSTIRSEKATKSWLYTTLYREFLKNTKRRFRVVALEERSMDYETIGDESGPLLNFDANSVMDLLFDVRMRSFVICPVYMEHIELLMILKMQFDPVLIQHLQRKNAIVFLI